MQELKDKFLALKGRNIAAWGKAPRISRSEINRCTMQLFLKQLVSCTEKDKIYLVQ
jgi:hypothetical protein